jgi:hypothetical protein
VSVALKIIIEKNIYSIDIPDDVMQGGESFFGKLDADMANGWQMNREWVESPNTQQRCQIVADRIADTINNENETLTYLLAGFIVSRMPGVQEVHIDTDGEMAETQFIFA